MINCPYCGKLTDPKLDSCVHCGGYLQRKQAGAAGGGRSRRQTCPNCQAEVEEGAILCVACGTNLLTGQKISEDRRGGRRKKSVSAGTVAMAVGAVVVVVALGLVLFRLSRDPVGQARELIEQGNLLGAQDMLSSHLADTPDDEEAQFLLGKVQLQNARPAEAAKSFERAYEVDDENVDALKLAVVSYAAANDAASRGNQIRALERLVAKQPEDVEAWYLLGLARGAQGDAAGQAEALAEVIEREATNAGALRQMAVATALQGDYEKAQTYLDRAAQHGGAENPSLQVTQGFLSALQEQPDAAVGELSAALTAQTVAQEYALAELGITLVQLNRFAEAEKALAQAVTIGGRGASEAARFFHGIALRALGRPDEAVAEFDLVSKGTGPYKVDGAVQAAQVFLERGNLVRAREVLESVAAQASTSAAFYTTRGRVLVLNGEDPRAEETFRQAIQVDPSYAGAYLEIGLLQLKSSRFDDALASLKRYLELAGPSTDPQHDQVRTLVEQLQSATPTPTAPDLANVASQAGQ